MFDRKLVVISLLNYLIGLNLYKYLIIKGYLEGFGAFLAPFIWLGLIVILFRTITEFRFYSGSYKQRDTREKVLPNLTLVFINAIFPFIALLRLDYYESLKESFLNFGK